MAKIYEKIYQDVSVREEESDATNITLTVPAGLDKNDIHWALKRMEFEVMRGR